MIRRLLIVLLLMALVGVGRWFAFRDTSYGVPVWQVGYFAVLLASQNVKCLFQDCDPLVPEGMVLAAFSEPYESTAVVLDVDAWGRVFVAESDRVLQGVSDNRFKEYWLLDDLAARTVQDRRAYIERWAESDEGSPLDWYTENDDRITRYEDTDGDGLADDIRVLARFQDVLDGIGAGVLIDGDEILYTNIPNLWRLRDADGDGEAEERDVVHTGFGVKTSLYGHDMHGLVWGPDGRLYWSIGDRGYYVETREGRILEPPITPGRGAVFRMNPDGSELEVFAFGLRNPQELAFDDFGNLITGDNNGDGGDEARIVYVAEGGDTGWAMPTQTLVDDYVRGPWNAERLWELQHDTQPAWILPPIAHFGRGPSGLAHYPGLGLPERYADHFFLSDYLYNAAISNIWSFAVEPAGAGMRMVDDHAFLAQMLTTDVGFSYDGRLFVSQFSQASNESQLFQLWHEEERARPEVARLTELARSDFAELAAGELAGILAFPDQRLRLRAQYELARRGDPEPFVALANDPGADLLARIHALWGLGQLGPDGFAATGWRDLAFVHELSDELRAQVVRAIGEAGASDFAADVADFLADPSLRVRYFAALTLGKLGATGSIPALIDLARENDDQDVFLRHGVVQSLHTMGAQDALEAASADASAAARRVVLLCWRRARDARIERFLRDPDPLLVVEAARAVYDLPIPGALPALAELADGELVYRDEDPQTSFALHRRVIGANRMLGDEASALRLARHASDAGNPRAMRRLALEVLREYVEPGLREPVWGMARALGARPPEVVHAALDRYGAALLEGELGDLAMNVALAHDRVPLEDDELVALVSDPEAEVGLRVSSLRALDGRAATARAEALETALASQAPELRAEARDAISARDAARGLPLLAAASRDGDRIERQRAYRTLGKLESPEARALISEALVAVAEGSAPIDVTLEILEASEAQELDASRVRAAASPQGEDPAAAYRFAFEGGDAERGLAIFQTNGDCQRCHGGGGHGASVGPDLAGVAASRGPEHLVRSMVDPQAEITEGFATVALTRVDGEIVSGTLLSEDDSAVVLDVAGREVRVPSAEIESRSEAVSGMPPMGLSLSRRDLRDVVAYLQSLEGEG